MIPCLLGVVAGCAAEPQPEVPPRQISPSTFYYPEELWDAGVEGETVLRIRVSEDGRVDSALVERTSGQAAFDSAAVAGAHALRFVPARRGEAAAASWAQLPVRFRLDAVPPDSPSPEPPPVP